MDALIGYTGFVGGHLRAQHEFQAQFNSRNMGEAAGGNFGTVVCAAAPGSMFEANRFPDQDQQRIAGLIEQLAQMKAERFVLISSIAVLSDFAGGDDETSDRFQTELAYGRHRRELEAFCADHFRECLIVRLPALFGKGLKKNFLFDILNPMPSMLPVARLEKLLDLISAELREGLQSFYALDAALGMLVIDRARYNASPLRLDCDAAVTAAGMSAIQFAHAESEYQYYEMTALWSDVRLSQQQGFAVIHLATEPVRAGLVFEVAMGHSMPATAARIHREDMRTRHGGLWGSSSQYIYGADEVLRRLGAFFASEREANVEAGRL